MPRVSSLASNTTRSWPRLGAYFVVLVLPMVGCAFGGRAGPGPQKDGRTVYLEDCASCHGTGGRGDGPAAQAFKRPPIDLTELAARSGGTFPRQSVRDVITGDRSIAAHGDREMPVWKERFLPTSSGATVGATLYTQRHLERLLAYLESIQRPRGEEK